MSMRRFFRAQRDEDHSQIQYLTAKCTRLAHDKAVVEREFLLCRERERKLHNELQAAAAQLEQQQQSNAELRLKQEQLFGCLRQQQHLVDVLQRRVVLLAEESSRDAELLRHVGAELLCLQSSEVKLESLVEELHGEAQHRAAVAEGLQEELRAEAQSRAALTESLQEELHSRTEELQQLRDVNRTLAEELKALRGAHHSEVRELQQENEGSLRKLQETAEQFEWLCEQQRYWMCCIKRFKDSLMKEREALRRQVSALETQAEKLRGSSAEDAPTRGLRRPLQDTDRCNRSTQTLQRSVASWDALAEAEPETSDTWCEQRPFEQAGSPINRYQKPP